MLWVIGEELIFIFSKIYSKAVELLMVDLALRLIGVFFRFIVTQLK